MFVKPSYVKITYRASLLALTSLSLTACQTSDMRVGSWWKGIDDERQNVNLGPRRIPMLNKDMMENGQPAQQTAQNDAAPARPTTSAPQAMQAPQDTATQQQYYYDETPANEPHVFDQIGSWFNSLLEDDRTTQDMQLASDDQTMVLALADSSDMPKRKPIAGNPKMLLAKEEETITLAESTKLPDERKIVGLQKKAPTPVLDAAPNPPLKEEESLEVASLPWQDSPMQTPIPPTMPAEQRMSLLAPAAGTREQENEQTVENQPDNNDSITLMVDSLLKDVKVNDEPEADTKEPPKKQTSQTEPVATPVVKQAQKTKPAPQEMAPLIDKSATVKYLQAPKADSAPSVVVNMQAMDRLAAPMAAQPTVNFVEEEVELASSSDLQLAESQPDYPPLRSVPPVPSRMQEVQAEHPVVKQQLMDEKSQAERTLEDVAEQLRMEQDESLIHNPPPAPTPMQTGNALLFPLPPTQFADARWSGPRIAYFAPVESSMPIPALATAHQPVRTGRPSVDQLLEKVTVAKVEDAQAQYLSEVKTLADAAEQGFKASKMKRQVAKALSVLPAYVSMPVMQEQRETVYIVPANYLSSM